MKKYLFLLAFMAFGLLAGAQTFTLTPDTTGTIAGLAGGRTHYYTSPSINTYAAWTVDLYVTTGGTHATDSTIVTLEASMDGENYFKVSEITPKLLGTSAWRSTGVTAILYTGKKYSSEGTGAVGWVWAATTPLTYKYIRLKVTQYKALSVLTINRAKLSIFK